MNSLDSETRTRIVAALVEGVSINSVVRMTGVAKTTILRLIREVGTACARFHDAQVRYLPTLRVQCDEVWSFCGMKQKNVPPELQGTIGIGSVWTWTAIDADTRLLVSFIASDRSQDAADAFMRDLKSRLFMRVQISTDGLPCYLESILKTFRYGEADHAEIVKVYASSGPQPGTSPNSAASRYSPGRLLSIEKHAKFGMPLTKYMSTSYMERWNLTLRMQNRRFTRLTNAFSKKFENHRHMLAMTVVFYNFCKTHKSLGGKTPAMATHLTDYVWTTSDLLAARPHVDSRSLRGVSKGNTTACRIEVGGSPAALSGRSDLAGRGSFAIPCGYRLHLSPVGEQKTEESMAARKQFHSNLTVTPELDELLRNASSKPASEDELREQRISFAFGNAPVGSEDLITKDSVRRSSLNIRLK